MFPDFSETIELLSFSHCTRLSKKKKLLKSAGVEEDGFILVVGASEAIYEKLLQNSA